MSRNRHRQSTDKDKPDDDVKTDGADDGAESAAPEAVDVPPRENPAPGQAGPPGPNQPNEGPTANPAQTSAQPPPVEDKGASELDLRTAENRALIEVVRNLGGNPEAVCEEARKQVAGEEPNRTGGKRFKVTMPPESGLPERVVVADTEEQAKTKYFAELGIIHTHHQAHAEPHNG